MRLIAVCSAVLLLSGCVESNTDLASSLSASASSSSPRPKTIVVSDFNVSSEVLLIDRGYTARLERKIGAFPTHERKPRTMDRVNDEIVASMVATLREAGLDAQPGAEEGLTSSSNAMVVSGRLRPSDANAKKNEAGIGGGKSNVTADIKLSAFSTFGKRELMSFSAEANAKLPTGKAAAANNSEVSNVLAGLEGAKEKLSADVEAAARKLGRAAGEKIVAYAKTQGWLNRPEGEDVAAKPTEAKSADAKPVVAKPTSAKPAGAKPAAEPAAKPAEDDAATEGQGDAEEATTVKLPDARPKKKPAA